MTRLINADALIKKWENVHSKDMSFAMAVIGAINDLKNAPTIDAVPVKHGEWIPCMMNSRGFTDTFKCSECKWYSYYAYPVKRLDYKYCPHCGARMDEV